MSNTTSSICNSMKVCSLPDLLSSSIMTFYLCNLTQAQNQCNEMLPFIHNPMIAQGKWKISIDGAFTFSFVSLEYQVAFLALCLCSVFLNSYVISMPRKAWLHHKGMIFPPELQLLAKILYETQSYIVV